MNQSRMRKMIIEMIVIVVISIAAAVGGIYLSASGKEYRRQVSYKEKFVQVIPCDHYELLKSPFLNDYKDINEVYIGYDSEGAPKGYIMDVSSTDEYGYQMHLLVGIDYESSVIKGLVKLDDTDNPAAITVPQFNELKESLMDKRIPIAFTDNAEEEQTDTQQDIVINGLHDGVYFAQSVVKDSKDYIDYVEIEIISGRIAHVKWDGVNLDPTTEDRSEASLSGAYRITGLDWATQSYNACHALIEVQNPDLLNMKSDGTTSIIEGVTCDIRQFVELSKQCIEYAADGYRKEQYLSDMDVVLEHTMRGNSVSLGLVNENGFVVVSFDKYLAPFEIKNSDGVVIGLYTIRELAQQYTSGDSDTGASANPGGRDDGRDIFDISPTPVPEDSGSTDYIDGAEDGRINPDVQGDNELIESIDDLPMSEIASYIDVIPGAGNASKLTVTCINTCYKFMKDYLNWLV